MSEKRLTATIIGYGAVGRALALALQQAGAKIVNIAEHEDSERIRLAQEEGFQVFPLEMARVDVDLVVLAVPDGKIAEVARGLRESIDSTSSRNLDGSGAVPRVESGLQTTALHLSGRVGPDVLAPLAQLGWGSVAWHPIQTFPPLADSSRFKGITIGMTGDETGERMGEELAALLGARTIRVPEQDRARYHLASVLASNFMPMLLEMGAQRFSGIASSLDEAWHALLPLLKGMLESIEEMGPAGAMTGPVARDDLETVLAHLATFSNPKEEELYRSLIHGLLSLAVRSGRMSQERSKAWFEAIGPMSGRN